MIESRVFAAPRAEPQLASGKRSWWRRRAEARTQRGQEVFSDHLRQITTQLLLTERPDSSPWLIGVTSAIQGEGKTTVAYGLATTLATDLDERVVLVELNFAAPVLADRLGLAPSPGLAEVIEQHRPLASAARTTHSGNLTIVPAGHLVTPMPRLVHHSALNNVWSQLGELGSIIVCDMPPVLATPITSFLLRHMKTLLLTVRAGGTPTSLVQEALSQIDANQLAGIVLNGEQSRLPKWLAQLISER